MWKITSVFGEGAVVVDDVDNDEEGHGIAVGLVGVLEEDGREVGLLLGPMRKTDTK